MNAVYIIDMRHKGYVEEYIRFVRQAEAASYYSGDPSYVFTLSTLEEHLSSLEHKHWTAVNSLNGSGLGFPDEF